MARKCVCKICKTTGDTDTFFKVREGNVNKYYCSKDEYENDLKVKQQRKELMEYIAIDVLAYEEGQIVNPIMIRKINELNKFYDLEVILETFKQSKENIHYWMNNKNFANEFGMVSYIMKIVEGNINDVHSKWKHLKSVKIKQDANNLDVNIINDIEKVKVSKKKKEDILSFLDEEDV